MWQFHVGNFVQFQFDLYLILYFAQLSICICSKCSWVILLKFAVTEGSCLTQLLIVLHCQSNATHWAIYCTQIFHRIALSEQCRSFSNGKHSFILLPHFEFYCTVWYRELHCLSNAAHCVMDCASILHNLAFYRAMGNTSMFFNFAFLHSWRLHIASSQDITLERADHRFPQILWESSFLRLILAAGSQSPSKQAPNCATQSETMTYLLTHSLTGVRCRATSVAKNRISLCTKGSSQ